MAAKRIDVPYYHHVVIVLIYISLNLTYTNAASYSVSVSPTTVGINRTVTLSCRITNPTGFSVMWRRKNRNNVFVEIAMASSKAGCNVAVDATKFKWDICDKPTTGSPREYSLKLIKAQPSDTGTWNCLDVGAGTPSVPVKVKVQGSSADYTVSASNVQPAIGDPVILYCKLSSSPGGFTVQWRRRTSPTSIATLIAQTTSKQACTIVQGVNKYQWDLCNNVNTEFNLKILKAEEADSAYWDCYDIGKGGASNLLHLQVKVPPVTPVVTGLEKPVGVDTTHTLTCDAHQPGISDTITYTWYKDNTVKATGNKLHFTPVTKTDAGTYKCEAKNAVATKVSQNIDLEVYYPPDSIILTATKSTRPINEKETFTCTISGSNPPNPTLTIYRDKGGKQQLFNGTGSTIELKDVTMVKDDNGAKYYCESSLSGYQTVSKKSNEITYNVHYPHSVTLLSNSSATVVVGSTFILTCNATGGNPATVQQYSWTRNGKTLQSTSRVYNIHNVKYDEGGMYACTAKNEGGSASGSMNITINYPPMWNPALPEILTSTAIINQPAKLTLHVIANPAATSASWFRYYGPTNFTTLGSDFTPAVVNETTYTLAIKSVTQTYFGDYKVDVASPNGPTTFIFKLTTPDKPYAPCCLNITFGTSISVTLTFQAGFFGGAAQTFTIQYREENGDWRVAKDNVKDPGAGLIATVKIADLTEKTRYDFRVFSTNVHGRSNFSNVAGTKTDAAPPIVADDISVIRKDTTITISWKDLNRQYTKIEVVYCVIRGTNRGACLTHDVTDTSVTTTTITVEEGKEYTYTLRIYDTDDMVFASPALASRTELPIIIIAGGAAGGGALLLIIIIITAVCVSKKRKDKEKSDIELHRVIKTSTSVNGQGTNTPGTSKKFHVFAKPHAKNTLKQKYQDSLMFENRSKKKGSMDIGRINPGFEEEFKRRDEARKDSLASILDRGHFAYEDVSINNYCPKMTSNESASAEVELRTPDPTRRDITDSGQDKLDLSSLIDKSAHAAPTAEYAQVDLTKKTRPAANNLNEPPVVKVNNSDVHQGAVYAEVDLSKKKNRPHLTVDDVSVDGSDPDQSFEIKIRVKGLSQKDFLGDTDSPIKFEFLVEVPSPKPGHKSGHKSPGTAPKPKTKAKPGSTYENTDIRTNVNKLNITPSEDGAYANTGGDNIYQEVAGAGRAQNPPTVGVDGTIYADVNLMNRNPSKPRAIKDTEPSSEYAQVDFGKKAPPMNGPVEEI